MDELELYVHITETASTACEVVATALKPVLNTADSTLYSFHDYLSVLERF
jgi:hypothetical protein